MGIKKTKTNRQRFDEKAIIPKDPEACWGWTDSLNAGCAGFFYNGKMLTAAKASYLLNVGEIPEGLWVLHHCDNRECSNPKHLYLGTSTDNHRDATERGGRNNKLTEDDIPSIRGRFAAGESKEALGVAFNVSAMCIYYVVSRKTWKHIE